MEHDTKTVIRLTSTGRAVVFVLLAVLGAVIGFVVGAQLYTPNPNAFMDLGAVNWGVDGAVIGLLVGIALPLSVSWVLRRRAHRAQHQP